RSGRCATPVSRSREAASALTLGTEVRRTLLHLHGLDRRAATTARQSIATVNLELVLVLPRLAEQIEVRLVLQRRAPGLDGVLHDLLDRAVEPAYLLR